MKKEKKNLLKDIKHYISNNIFALKNVFKNAPSYFFITFIDRVMNTMLPSLIGIYFTKEFLGTVEKLVLAKETNVKEIIPVFLIVIGFMLIKDLWTVFSSRVYIPRINSRFNEKITKELYKKSLTFDLSAYDDPEFYDKYTWAVQRASGTSLETVGNVINLIVSVLTVVSIFGIVATMDWFAIIVIIVYVIITFIIDTFRSRVNYDDSVEENKIWRRISYVNRLFFQGSVAKEFRMTKVVDLILNRYKKDMEVAKKLMMTNIKKNFFISLVQIVMSNIIWDIVFTLVLVYRIVVSKVLTISGMVAIQQSAGRITNEVYSFLHCIDRFKELALYMDQYKEFLERKSHVIEEENAKPLTEEIEEIELKDIYFKYPGSEVYAIKGLNLKIGKHEKIALVGYNGAGKSTLIKLIMRLYQPEKGEIFINGKPASSFTVDSYREKFGAVFQESKLFSLTIAENVLMDKFDESKRQEVEQALEKAAFGNKLKDLPKGIETMLTREFDEEGVILSGGEQQKICIARTFVHNNEVIIMDEPSASLDPDSEYELNHLMMNSALDKSVIFISHRLSTTRMADRIYMMAGGEIVEEGSHDQLMKKDGKYAEMFKVQSEKYVKASEE